MIPIQTYIKWIQDIDDANIHLIAVGYNPSDKKRLLRLTRFEMENPITDIDVFSQLLSEIVERHVGTKFKVRLINHRYSFLPAFFPKNNSEVLLIKKYLNKIAWKNKKYFGSFTIVRLKDFLDIFIDYPLKYSYQDILLFSKTNDFVIQISDHGTIWLSSSSKHLIKIVGAELDKKGATVIYGNC